MNPTLVSVLSKVHESYKEAIKDRINSIASNTKTLYNSLSNSELLSLEDAYAALGRASFREEQIIKLYKLLSDAIGSADYPWKRPKELVALQENCRKQIKTLNEYIFAYKQHERKLCQEDSK